MGQNDRRIEKQISKMGKKTKVAKKVVASANDSAARGEAEIQQLNEDAAEGLGLPGLPAVAGGGSGGKSMVEGDAAPPALGTLDDGGSQPVVVGPSSEGG